MQVPPFSLTNQISELQSELDDAVLRVIHSGQYIGGNEVQSFEESYASRIGVPYVVSCNSGTDALILALRALEIGPGDEVITCSFSFFATAEAISMVGAKPVFIEVDPSNYLLDLELIEKAINPSTKAILPVHLFGSPVDMEQVMHIANSHNLKVIEDCAQSAGAKWNSQPLGSFGDVGCFSFFPTKNLGAAGDGGAVSTKDPLLAKRMRELAVHGSPYRYFHSNLGYNSRLDAIQAAILNVKLPKLSYWVEQRKKIALRYKSLLQDLPGIELPFFENNETIVQGWNQFVVKIKGHLIEGKLEAINSPDRIKQNKVNEINSRDWLKKNIEEKGVYTIVYYPIPIHLQPAYKNLGYKSGSLPVTETLCGEVLSLPIFPEITLEQQEYVVKAIKEFFVEFDLN